MVSSDSELSFGSDLFKDEEDMRTLVAMTELQREMILYERSEKLNNRRAKQIVDGRTGYRDNPSVVPNTAGQNQTRQAQSSAKRRHKHDDVFEVSSRPPAAVHKRNRDNEFDRDQGTEKVLSFLDGIRPPKASRLVRIQPGGLNFEVPEGVKTTVGLRDWLKSMGCEWYRRNAIWRMVSEPISEQLPPEFMIEALQYGAVRMLLNI